MLDAGCWSKSLPIAHHDGHNQSPTLPLLSPAEPRAGSAARADASAAAASRAVRKGARLCPCSAGTRGLSEQGNILFTAWSKLRLLAPPGEKASLTGHQGCPRAFPISPTRGPFSAFR